MLCKCGCGSEFEPEDYRQKFLNTEHRAKYYNTGNYKRYASQRRMTKCRGKSEPYKPKRKRRILTDDQQRKIDAAVDKKYAVKCEARVLRGAEFRRVAAELIERERRLGKRLEMRG